MRPALRAACVMVTLLAGGCSGGASDEVVRIGFTGPLSGGAALYGRNVLDGLRLAVDDINAAGGVDAGGRRIRVARRPLLPQ
jgi:branched-chain amino acid transport system substrate-binding protein